MKSARALPAIAALFAGLAMTATSAFADCTRHIYNRSLDVWAYGFVASADAQLTDDAARILPGEAHVIEYDAASAGKWMATAQITEVSGKPQFDGAYAVEGCYLRHDGVTGRAVLNDPADGDIILLD